MPGQELAVGGIDAIRAYEDAATAIGRLDAAACAAEPGLRELLFLRCAATATGTAHAGMIALIRADREGVQPPPSLGAFAHALREGAARAKGGALQSLEAMHHLLMLSPPPEPMAAINDLLRDAHERVPPVLKAALAARAFRASSAAAAGESPPRSLEPHLATLAVPLILCVGGATTDAWITLPHATAAAAAGGSLRDTFAALAREARAAERGLDAARDLCDADQQRVRDALGRAAYSALDVLALLRREIVITVPEAARALGLTPPTAGAAVARLVELRIAREITGKARLRAFSYEAMITALAPAA